MRTREAGPSLLTPDEYCSPAIAAAESQRLFRRLWHFVGFTDELPVPDGWLTRTIAGVPVAIQRFDDQIRAFRNVCSHRHALIHRGAAGTGPLRCLYHGWTYNRDGAPLGIPDNETCFALDRAGKQALALTAYEVALRGRFIFVRLEAGGPDLDRWLGETGGWLDAISDGFDAPFDQSPLPWAADWKIGIENVLEVYHVASVHPETFATVTEGEWRWREQGPHSTASIGLTAETRRWWDGVRRRLALAPVAPFHDYDHAFIFPNLAIGITAGMMASVQTYEPLYEADGTPRPGQSHVRYRLSLARRQDGESGSQAARAGVTTHLAAFNQRLLGEDREACEATWAGSLHATRPGLLGSNEGRLRAFHEAWKDQMAAPAPDAAAGDAASGDDEVGG